MNSENFPYECFGNGNTFILDEAKTAKVFPTFG